MDLLQTLVVFFGVLNLTFAGFLMFNSAGSRVVRLYALISVFAVLWTFSTLATGLENLSFGYLKLALYGHYIFGYLAYLSFFWFALYFPQRSVRSLVPSVVMSLATFAFLVCIPIQGFMLDSLREGSSLAEIITFGALGYPAFVVMLSSVFFLGLVVLLLRLRQYDETTLYRDLDKYQIHFALYANLVAGVLGITFNLIFPLFGNFDFFYVNPILVTGALTIIGLYNISRHDLFNARVFLAEFFTAGLLIISLTRLVLAPPGTQRIIDAIVLVVMLGFGALLIQSVMREVKQRKLIEAQRKDLEIANQKQESLLHFISHEIKGYLTEGQNAFAAIVEGDFGTAPPKVHALAQTALQKMRKGVETVMDILDASNLKKGTVAYKKEKLDFRVEVESAVQEMRPAASEKHLALELTLDDRHTYEYIGDKDKLHHHVIRNLIDNAIKYTPKGSIHVTLTKTEHAIGLSVKDTGVGITEEDKPRLFTEGGHGKNSIKVNVDSTGYGLFIAKEVVEAHGGTIHVESAGAGKGSEFIVELPI